MVDVITCLGPAGSVRNSPSKVIGFGAPAGKDKFRRARAQGLGNAFPRSLQLLPRPLSVAMDARCVAEVLL